MSVPLTLGRPQRLSLKPRRLPLGRGAVVAPRRRKKAGLGASRSFSRRFAPPPSSASLFRWPLAQLLGTRYIKGRSEQSRRLAAAAQGPPCKAGPRGEGGFGRRFPRERRRASRAGGSGAGGRESPSGEARDGGGSASAAGARLLARFASAAAAAALGVCVLPGVARDMASSTNTNPVVRTRAAQGLQGRRGGGRTGGRPLGWEGGGGRRDGGAARTRRRILHARPGLPRSLRERRRGAAEGSGGSPPASPTPRRLWGAPSALALPAWREAGLLWGRSGGCE